MYRCPIGAGPRRQSSWPSRAAGPTSEPFSQKPVSACRAVGRCARRGRLRLASQRARAGQGRTVGSQGGRQHAARPLRLPARANSQHYHGRATTTSCAAARRRSWARARAAGSTAGSRAKRRCPKDVQYIPASGQVSQLQIMRAAPPSPTRAPSAWSAVLPCTLGASDMHVCDLHGSARINLYLESYTCYTSYF